MGHLKRITLVAMAALALIAFAASSASATTIEVKGGIYNGPVTITASLKSGTSAVLRDTFGFFGNTCLSSHVHGTTFFPYSASAVTAGLAALSFNNCDHTVTVHKPGQLYVEWTSGTNGRVFSENAEVTSYSTIHGTHVNCKTGAGTLIGTLTGTSVERATLDVNATLTCGPHLHSAKWTGTYTVTSPEGLGISP